MGKSEKKRGFNWFVLALALIVLYFSSILISQQLYLNQVGRDQAASDARLQAALQENEALLREKEKLNDVDYIERVAREELGMTREGEIPYSTVRREREEFAIVLFMAYILWGDQGEEESFCPLKQAVW